jgi:Spy/CpxP family protein refolding chaperone
MNSGRKFFGMVFSALMIGALVAACSSSDPYDAPPPDDRPMRGGGGRGGFRGAPADAQGDAGGLGMLPQGTCWHDDQIARAVNLSSDQVAALEKISSEQGDDIARLIRDTPVAVNALRDSLDADPVKSDDIIAAGQRLRTMRDTTLERQVKILAAERQVLSRQQWTALQNAMQARRSERQQDRRGGYPRGGRGGMGGRRPGFPG